MSVPLQPMWKHLTRPLQKSLESIFFTFPHKRNQSAFSRTMSQMVICTPGTITTIVFIRMGVLWGIDFLNKSHFKSSESTTLFPKHWHLRKITTGGQLLGETQTFCCLRLCSLQHRGNSVHKPCMRNFRNHNSIFQSLTKLTSVLK